MAKQIRLAKADMELIEKAVMCGMSADAGEIALIHTNSPRIEKLVANGLFDVISPKLSGRRTTGYNLTLKGREAFTRAAGA
ncbi:hypothetical protein AB6T85_21470 [Erwinia sp. ACCC 02193]|jgi:hypothetical protein|uniref:Chromosome segregation protein ParM n=1 Tax=Erwinia aeris TaxID=3239803 RepID=A0ABV4EDP9_9GAMM